MEYQYPFLNRKSEIDELKAAFAEKIIKNKTTLGYIIQGRKKIGKSRLIEEFLNIVENDIEIHSDVPNFTRDKHVINYICDKDIIKPYLPFIKIAEEIRKKNKLINISIKFVQLGLAIFGINDALKALKDLVDNIQSGKSERVLDKKEVTTFNRYRNFIRRRSKKVPLIIFIQNIQWIDNYSLKLIKKLVYEEHSMWGMIILEEDEGEIEEEIQNGINQFKLEGKFQRLVLTSLDKNFPQKLLTPRFGPEFINGEENDILYSISEGCPGILIEFIDSCLKNNWIFFKDNKCYKADDFFEKIKPASQKLLELIISLYEDRELSAGELRLIKQMSVMWGVSDKRVSDTIYMVKDIMNSRYKLIQDLGPGIISRNCFLALDKENNRMIIEYIRSIGKPHKRSFYTREIEHRYLLEAKEIKICDEGVMVIWNYFEGKRSRQIRIKAFETRILDVKNKFLQISLGLAELHRNESIHGCLRPESIIEKADGNFQLASFDFSVLNEITDFYLNIDSDNIYYLAPETLDCKLIDARSDIYSLGVLFYKSLTDKFPYHGTDKSELISAIKNGKLQFSGYLHSLIPDDVRSIIKKSLDFDPNKRYKSAKEFHEDLKKIELKKPEPIQDPVKPPSPRKRIIKWAALIFIPILLFVGIYYLIFFRESTFKKSITDKITFNVDAFSQNANPDRIISSDVLEYLLIDDLIQSSNLVVLTPKEFKKIHPSSLKEKFFPILEISASIINREFNYKIKLELKNNITGNSQDSSFSFNEPSQLLKGGINSITRKVLNQMNIAKLKNSTFTQDWDAFIDFYEGEKAWLRLDKTLAHRSFTSAINIDPAFILCKLRLADIYRFEGNNSKALETLNTVKPELGLLSIADSLKAVALQNILEGNIRKAIDNYKALIEFLPARKDSYYNLAEAYFQLREILNAKVNYELALSIDPEFTPAINHYGYCFSHLGDHQEALRQFRRYVELDSSANSFDSMGDGFLAAGILDSAIWAKNEGLKLDPDLEYLYNSLGYIYSRRGEFDKAEENIDNFIKLSKNYNELIAEGLVNKSLVYFRQGKVNQAYDTCMKAKELYDPNDLISRNHKMHWLIAQIYFQKREFENVISKVDEMEGIINHFDVNFDNYHEIIKYYLHLQALLGSHNSDLEVIKEKASIFDFEIKEKVKDWGSPFDLAFFNTEFARIYMSLENDDLAIIRLNKALAYNPNFALAHYYLSNIYGTRGDDQLEKKHLISFRNNWHGTSLQFY